MRATQDLLLTKLETWVVSRMSGTRQLQNSINGELNVVQEEQMLFVLFLTL